MARLRNRIRKSDYFSDGELLRWHRDKRQTYSGLYALAEDSGCLEDDVYVWKFLLWPSPLDDDITVEVLGQWRDELVQAKKLIPYEVNGQRYLFMRSFHNHEHPRNPQRPSLPLPPWVEWLTYPDHPHKGQYVVDEKLLASTVNGTAKPRKRKSKAQVKVESTGIEVAQAATLSDSVLESEFTRWWAMYGRVGTKAKAQALYLWWRREGKASFKDLLTAAVNYREHCAADDQTMMHGSTFLARPGKNKVAVWPEWAAGEEHGSMKVRSRGRVNDVIDAASRAFGLRGDEDDERAALPAGSGEDAGDGDGEDEEYADTGT